MEFFSLNGFFTSEPSDRSLTEGILPLLVPQVVESPMLNVHVIIEPLCVPILVSHNTLAENAEDSSWPHLRRVGHHSKCSW